MSVCVCAHMHMCVCVSPTAQARWLLCGLKLVQGEKGERRDARVELLGWIGIKSSHRALQRYRNIMPLSVCVM